MDNVRGEGNINGGLSESGFNVVGLGTGDVELDLVISAIADLGGSMAKSSQRAEDVDVGLEAARGRVEALGSLDQENAEHCRGVCKYHEEGANRVVAVRKSMCEGWKM